MNTTSLNPDSVATVNITPLAPRSPLAGGSVVGAVKPVHTALAAGVQPALADEFPVGVGAAREAARHPDSSLGKPADHLAERGVLAAEALARAHSEPVEIRHVFQPRHG